MVIVKEKDFVEVSYTGKVKETDQIFDLTDEETAKKEGFHEIANSFKQIGELRKVPRQGSAAV